MCQAASAGSPAASVQPQPVGAARQARSSVRLAIIGDVHGAWIHEREVAALRHLNPDLVLLVGDFGNEAVALVQQIATLQSVFPTAAILGNHDAW